jgi:hypothetical protein
MQVLVFFDENKSLISLWGRTDYPDCGDFKIPVRPGESFLGLSFEELTKIGSFETDPKTQTVIKTTPRQPRAENPPPIPDFLRKKPAQS